jgi:hypothetical protein
MADIRHIGAPDLIDRVGRALRRSLESFQQSPVPERWVDLLKRLNEEERSRRERDGCPR